MSEQAVQPRCSKCGSEFTSSNPAVRHNGEFWCRRDYEQLQQAGQGNQDAVARIPITTAPSLAGFRVVETIDVIAAECAFGMNLFRDFFAGVTDVFGGRSHSTQTVLRDARIQCLTDLRREAQQRGANAVIAVDLDYSEFSGQGKSMLFLVASGTAVRVEPQNSASAAEGES